MLRPSIMYGIRPGADAHVMPQRRWPSIRVSITGEEACNIKKVDYARAKTETENLDSESCGALEHLNKHGRHGHEWNCSIYADYQPHCRFGTGKIWGASWCR
jgi:hypothetical protein